MEHLKPTADRRQQTVARQSKSAVHHLPSAVILFAALYAITLCWLSFARHAAHQTNALDLGYYSNTLWNTAHGQPFRFTTYHDANFFFPEFNPNAIKQQDSLLAYHVEPMLLPLSLIYWLWPDPRALLILQSLVLASGAWPAYQIARRHLAHEWLALVFPLIYLMSPSLVGANLSDFHPVTMSAALFLWAFEMRERRSFKWYFLFIVLILALKEEMGLMVAMLGVYQVYRALRPLALPLSRHGLMMALRYPRVQVGLITLTLAVLWTLIAILIQREAAGRSISPFVARYSWLGHSIPDVLRNGVTTPIIFDWLKRPEVNGYLGFLLAQVGFIALFAPEVLLVALPEIGLNAFSRFEWMRSGVAHYSAPIVPCLVIATIFGAKRVGDWKLEVGGWRLGFGIWPATLIALLFALFQCYRAGQLPLTQDFAPFNVTAHHARLASIAARIPPTAKVSAQSDLYPHVPGRADLYLFPTISDADYILLDVSGQTYPIGSNEYPVFVKQIVNEAPVGILVAEDGYLLLARDEGANIELPDQFFAFVRGDVNAITHPLRVRFGDSLELLGYDVEWLAPRNVPMPALTVRTYWRALQPIADNWRLVYSFYAPAGYRGYRVAGSPTEAWYPTSRWKLNEVIVVEQRGVQVSRGGRIGISVEGGEIRTPLIVQPRVSEKELIEAGVVKLDVGN